MRPQALLISILCLLIVIIIPQQSCKKDDKEKAPDPISISVSEEDQTNLFNQAAESYEKYLTTYSEKESCVKVGEELSIDSLVNSAGVCADSTTIWWELIDGFECYYLTVTMMTLSDTTNSKHQNNNNKKKALNSELKSLVHTQKALILSPFQWQMLKLDIADETLEYALDLKQMFDYDVNYKSNINITTQKISLEDYKIFDDYGVVALSTHGYLDKNDRVMLITGIMFTDSIKRVYKEDWIGEVDNLMLAKIKGYPSVKYFSVSPSWFEKYNGEQLDNTFFYIGCCEATKNNTLSNVLLGQNSVYCGWSNPIGITKANLTSRALFHYLTWDSLNCNDTYIKLVENNGSFSK